MACSAFVLTLSEIACLHSHPPAMSLRRQRPFPQTLWRSSRVALQMVSPDQVRKRKRAEREIVSQILDRLSSHTPPPFDSAYVTLSDETFEEIEWSSVPMEVDPHFVTWRGNTLFPGAGSESHAKIKSKLNPRSLRKRSQIENFAAILKTLSPPAGSVVVDFGSGSGNLALALAHEFPDLHFIGLDMKSKAIDIFRERADGAALPNIELRLEKIENFDQPFDIALALHTCGASSDMVMEQAIKQNASFFVSPCCIGKVNVNKVHIKNRRLITEPDTPPKTSVSGSTTLHNKKGNVVLHTGGQSSAGYFGREVEYPRSDWLRQVANSSEYALIAKCADRSEATAAFLAEARLDMSEEEYENLLRCATCKTIVETDRQAWATQQGYAALLLRMRGMDQFAKTDLLAGFPAAQAPAALATLRQSVCHVTTKEPVSRDHQLEGTRSGLVN